MDKSIQLNSEDREYLLLAYNKAIMALKKNITPMGFSACSLTDNEVTGTDVNYRSVWGRDGALTVISSLFLEDEDIRDCQKNTLITLISHMSSNGQIPSNVRIDDLTPDYSGVGNICSIDSGLWTIIAFYEYIERYANLEFLHNHWSQIKQAMFWLKAQDSNNDSLLEVPEAGDWTDLLGRRYHILYDEILWYRVQFCYEQLATLMRDDKEKEQAKSYSEKMQKVINDKFWPMTNLKTPVSFDERQFALGDACYLIAQLTPFDYDWRCDIFGNVLAFLYDCIDIKRAKKAFRFMWRAGVNRPYPVKNLYPVISPGDPLWRDYYTVNFLNLPNHYHNGGIWPFIGGHWVRFIHKLGQPKIALQELLQLAKLNQQGLSREWEFNEWAHGQTGLPMGKVYQAWSAAQFIHAYHTVMADK